MLIDSNNDIILINSQTLYNGQVSNGINKININGDNVNAYSVNLFSKGRVTQFDNYENGNYLISGSFIESSLSKTAHISAFSLNANQSFPWVNSVDLVASDLMGSAKILSNGDIFIGAYDRSQSGIFKVHTSDGSAIDLGVNQAYAVEVTYPVSNIHESNDFIYATGVFSYQSKFNVIKWNKDYSIVSSYTPSVTQFGDNIPFSYLSNDDKLIVQITNSTDQTNNIIRLLPNGNKDNSFNDLTIGNMNFGGSRTFVVKDSLLVSQPIDFNNTQTLKSYNLDGTLLDDNFASINANAIISDIIAISDTVAIISGSFTSINGIAQNGIALMHFNGVVYDDLDLDITGSISEIELKNDTLFILGPGAIENKNNGGFYAISLKPNALNLNPTSTSETGGIMLSWQSDQTIRYIDIYRSSLGNSTSLISTLEKGSDSYLDENIEPNIPYTYNLVSRIFFGDNSTELTFEVIKPNAPSNLSVQYSDGNIDLTWNDESDNEIGFNLFRKIDNGDFEDINFTDANVTNSTDISVEIDHTYTYFINAKSDNYFSESTDSVEIKIYLPTAPGNLSYNYDNSLATISLAWDYSDENAENIIIYESLDNQSFNALDTISSSELSFDKNNTIENGVYYYNIVAKNNIGLSNASETIEVNTSILWLDISENQHHIFPNPSTGNLRIELNSNEIDEVIITDISGKIIQKIPTKGHSYISVSGLSSGVYLVGFATRNQLTEVEKIIVK